MGTLLHFPTERKEQLRKARENSARRTTRRTTCNVVVRVGLTVVTLLALGVAFALVLSALTEQLTDLAGFPRSKNPTLASE